LENKQITEQLDFVFDKEEFSWDGVWKDGETWAIIGGFFVFFVIMIVW
jgi:hypothetical protein